MGETAYLGPHIGDLETLETCRSFEESVERLQRFLGLVPDLATLRPDLPVALPGAVRTALAKDPAPRPPTATAYATLLRFAAG